jgi:CRP-like cAMP-binding protein
MLGNQVDRVLDHALFRGLSRDRLRPSMRSLDVHAYAARQIVADPTMAPALHLVLSGRLRAFDVTCAGRRVTLDYIDPGDIDGALAVAGPRGHFTEADAASDVVTIAWPALEDMLEAEPGLAVNLLRTISDRLHRREDQLARMALRSPDQWIPVQLRAVC